MTSSEAPPSAASFSATGAKDLAVVDESARAGPAPRNAPARCSPLALEAVAGVRQAEPRHQPVARDLGDDRGGGDRGDQRIAGHHRLAVAAAVDLLVAVDEHQLRPARQRLDRARQRPQRGAQDVVAVDARDRAEGDRDLRRGADFLVQLFALFGVELLGVVQAARDALGIEHHRRRHHRTGERPPARLVAAGDRPDALVERAPLAPETRAE